MTHRTVYRGSRHKVIALELGDGSTPVEDFILHLERQDRSKVFAIIQRLGDTGRVTDPEKFKKVEDTNLFAIKSGDIRIFCFFSPDRKLVLLSATRKKSMKHKSSDLVRAEKYRQFYNEKEGLT